MKKALVVTVLCVCLALLCSCDGGLIGELVQDLPGATKQAEFHTYYDYGFSQPGKATLLMDGSTVFVDEKLIAGDVVTVYYTGEMYVQESYPGTVVFSGGEVKRVEVQKAKLCILTVTQNAQTGENQLVNQLDQPLTSAPDYALTDWDGSFVAWKELEVGTVLYGSFLDTTGELPTEVAGLYMYVPRI